MKKIPSILAGTALLLGAGMAPASAAPEGSGISGWLDGSNAYSNCYYETEPAGAGLTLQYVKYEKWCNVDFNPVTVWLRGVHDGGVYKVEEGNTDIYDKNFERTFNIVKPGMTGQIW